MSTPTVEELVQEVARWDGANFWPTNGERTLAQRLADALAELSVSRELGDLMREKLAEAQQREARLVAAARDGLDAIEDELMAAGDDAVQGHPTLRRHQAIAARLHVVLGEAAQPRRRAAARGLATAHQDDEGVR